MIRVRCPTCGRYLPPGISDIVGRFWASVEKAESDACWLWRGRFYKAPKPWQAYGRFSIGSKWRRAHRVAWELTREPIPLGMEVCHKCDVPACVRPDHLFLATHRENVQDAFAKGRMRSRPPTRGDKNARSLTAQTVTEIRKAFRPGASLTELGRRFGVHRSTIRRVVDGEIWGWLRPECQMKEER